MGVPPRFVSLPQGHSHVFSVNFAQEHPYASVQACHSLSAPVFSEPPRDREKKHEKLDKQRRNGASTTQNTDVMVSWRSNGDVTGIIWVTSSDIKKMYSSKTRM